MSLQPGNNKIFIFKLINSISIESVISSFQSIEKNWLNIMHSISGEISLLSNNASCIRQNIQNTLTQFRRICNGFNENLNQQYFHEIIHSAGVLQKLLQSFEDQIELNKSTHLQLSNNLDAMFVSINGCCLNLTELEALFTGIKSGKHLQAVNGKNIAEFTGEMLTFCRSGLDQLNKLRKFVANSLITVDSLKKNYLEDTYPILSFCRDLAELVIIKQKQAAELKPLLEELNHQAELIHLSIHKHLQTKTTVRQKIEHIKKTQYALLNELAVFKEKPDQADFKLKLSKLCLHIREVVTSQLMQLATAQYDYQKAANDSNTEFDKYRACVREVNSLHGRFLSSSRFACSKSLNADLNIRREVNLSNEIDAINSIYKLQTEGIIQRIRDFSHSLGKLFKTGQGFLECISNINKWFNCPEEQEYIYEAQQLQKLAIQVSHSIVSLGELNDSNLTLIHFLHQKHTEQYLNNNYENLQKQQVKILSHAFREVNYLNRELLHLINVNLQVPAPEEAIESVDPSIQNKLVEMEIKYIISHFNYLLNTTKGNEVFSKNHPADISNTPNIKIITA